MQRPAHTSYTESTPQSLAPAGGGWHCSHLFYSFDHGAIGRLTSDARDAGIREVVAALDPRGPDAPIRLQTSITSGQKGDFGVMLLDPDPLKVDRVHQRIMAGPLGPAIVPRWSFVSMTEISEYVQSPEQFGERLAAEGMDPNTAEYKTRVKGYADRLVDMNRQRLTPDFPPYRATCFYPMNKKRKVGENWFTLPKEERSRLMIEHARSGMAFAGRVTQLITVGIGLEDWEWGVTLWAANPEFLKEIVYRMRFDEASARYAEFGPFYAGYVASASEILVHCRIST
ncbi:MAG TPA: hydrogen peroxide-dependent heme synthase [Lacipirellulaceae bacterium]|nr:hydrogen peroxide-dependent heme synthase [Lacipirellulaceae bacterium]